MSIRAGQNQLEFALKHVQRLEAVLAATPSIVDAMEAADQCRSRVVAARDELRAAV